jgi:acyl transferase domain-containing protein
MFSGQGSWRLGMGKNLDQSFPTLRTAMEDIAAHFTGL